MTSFPSRTSCPSAPTPPSTPLVPLKLPASWYPKCAQFSTRQNTPNSPSPAAVVATRCAVLHHHRNPSEHCQKKTRACLRCDCKKVKCSNSREYLPAWFCCWKLSGMGWVLSSSSRWWVMFPWHRQPRRGGSCQRRAFRRRGWDHRGIVRGGVRRAPGFVSLPFFSLFPLLFLLLGFNWAQIPLANLPFPPVQVSLGTRTPSSRRP